MKIIILSQHFAPEEVSGAVLATQFTGGLVERGHQVSFVTAAPSYPKGRVFEGYRNRWLQKQIIRGVEVIRVWSYIHPKKSFWRRFLNYFTFSLAAVWGGLSVGKVDLLFSYSPPLPLGLTAWLISRIRHVPWVLRVEDLFPDAAVAAGTLKNRAVISFFLWLERWLYRRADHISVISDGFRKILIEKGVPVEKLSVTPVWANPDEIQILTKDNSFRKTHNPANKFLVIYSGNMGMTCALEDVLQAASLLRSSPQILFLLIGEGVRKAELLAIARQLELPNTDFLPYQPRPTYLQALAAADLALVTLNHGSAKYSVPAKGYSSMASARPLLLVAPPGSDIAQIVQQSGCGFIVPPGNPQCLADKILEISCLTEAQLNKIGERGRSALVGRFSPAACIPQYEQLFNSLINEHHPPN